jgi:hypothetical protein
MDQYRHTRTVIALFVCLWAAGCAWWRPAPDEFMPLNPGQSRRELDRIVSATNGLHVVKCKGDVLFTVLEEGKPETRKADLLYLWHPGRKLRARVKYFGVTVLSILYDGKQWYLSDDMNNTVLTCSRVDRVHADSLPHAFFVQLQQLPGGWINQGHYRGTVAVNEHACRITTKTDTFTQVLTFPRGSAIPSEAQLALDDGSSLSAVFAAPVTNLTIRPEMFTPQYEGYTIRNLDEETAVNR